MGEVGAEGARVQPSLRFSPSHPSVCSSPHTDLRATLGAGSATTATLLSAKGPGLCRGLLAQGSELPAFTTLQSPLSESCPDGR